MFVCVVTNQIVVYKKLARFTKKKDKNLHCQKCHQLFIHFFVFETKLVRYIVDCNEIKIQLHL